MCSSDSAQDSWRQQHTSHSQSYTSERDWWWWLTRWHLCWRATWLATVFLISYIQTRGNNEKCSDSGNLMFQTHMQQCFMKCSCLTTPELSILPLQKWSIAASFSYWEAARSLRCQTTIPSPRSNSNTSQVTLKNNGNRRAWIAYIFISSVLLHGCTTWMLNAYSRLCLQVADPSRGKSSRSMDYNMGFYAIFQKRFSTCWLLPGTHHESGCSHLHLQLQVTHCSSGWLWNCKGLPRSVFQRHSVKGGDYFLNVQLFLK